MSKPSAAEKRFHLWVMDRGCSVAGCSQQPVVFHHEKQPYPKPRRDDKFGVGLCDPHHRELHTQLGWNIQRFQEKYGVNLSSVAKLNAQYWEK